ncbi:PKD domain-containing protein, partial [[Eubacterium] cellulosolvens]
YIWTFMDGPSSIIKYEYNARYQFNNPGVYIIMLTVTDYFSNTDTDSFTITVEDLTPPNFPPSADATGTPAYTGNSFTFLVSVTDYSLNRVNVIYWYGVTNATFWNITMVTSGTLFQYKHDITVLHTEEPLSYYFWANDSRKNWNILNGANSPIPVLDDDKPDYGLDSTPTSGTTGDPLTFSIVVTDNIRVDSGILKYKYGATGPYSSDTPLSKSGTTYTTTINVNHTLDPLYYKFFFKDTSDNTNWSTENMITIIDDDKPVFVSDLSDTSAYANETFDFSLDFDDNVEAFSAHVEFWFGTGQHKTKTLTKSGDYFIASIKIPNSLAKLHYKFYYNDTTPANINQSAEVVVDVIDREDPFALSGSGDIQATTGENFEVFAKFKDNIGINLVKLYYRNSTTWSEELITSPDDGKYSITNVGLEIDTTNDDIDWEYYFYAEDEAQNSVSYGSQDNPFDIIVTDNDKPVADAGEDTQETLVDDKVDVTFDGGGSTDNIGITFYKWTFEYDNDDQLMSGVKPTFPFKISGTYIVTLNVTDDAGNWDTDTVKVNIYSEQTPPNVKLEYPADGAKIPELSVTLRWSTSHPDAHLVKYNLEWGENKNNLDKGEDGISATEYELTGLQDKKTYFWRVQPFLGTTMGTFSPIQSFSIDLEFQQTFGVDITADKTSVLIQQGKSDTVTLTVENTGNSDDLMNIEVDKKNFPEEATISNPTLFLDDGQKLDITLTITTKELTQTATYKITVTAVSDGAEAAGQDVSDSVTIEVRVVEKPAGEDEDNDGLPDAWELKYWDTINQYDADDDPDGDGLSNLQEYYDETDPTKSNVDTDSDGLPDWWEEQYWGDITLYGPNDDPDGDEIPNSKELEDGTNPTISDKPQDGDGDGDGDGGDNTMAIAGAVVVIIIVVLLLLMLMMKKKKGAAAEKPSAPEPTTPPRTTPPGAAGPGAPQPGPSPRPQPGVPGRPGPGTPGPGTPGAPPRPGVQVPATQPAQVRPPMGPGPGK